MKKRRKAGNTVSKESSRNKSIQLPQKDKDTNYIMKTDQKMKILRIVLWVILGFIFLRGVMVCIHPDRTSEIKRLISDFKTKFSNMQDKNYEILGFSENFAQEYLTYETDGKESFRNRIAPYVSDRITDMEDIYDFKNSCKCNVAQAYKIEKISDNQVDAYVKAKVTYSYQDVEKNKTVMLRIPVFIGKAGYIVEDLPMYINDSMKAADYTYQAYSSVNEADSSKYEKTITNFLKAYYGTEQDVVNYYLSPDADKTKFYCLGGSLQLGKVNEIQAFELNKGIFCIVNFQIVDTVNGVILCQSVNIQLVNVEGRLYVSDINTRTGNIKED